MEIKRFAVIGKPVMHSLSPVMMNSAFEQLGQQKVYTRLRIEDASEILPAMKSLRLTGVNITAPFKQDILAYLDYTDSAVKQIGAVNTVLETKGKYVGYNTDFIGSMHSLKEMGLHLAGKRALVIGAGGAARAVLFGLHQNYASITITNRTEAKAHKLAQNTAARVMPMEDMQEGLRKFDIIINTIAADIPGLQPDWFARGQFILDANYNKSRFTQTAEAAGCHIAPGSRWLINQAVPAFFIFSGKKPRKHILEAALKEHKKLPPQKVVIYSDLELGEEFYSLLSQKTGMDIKDGDKLDIFTTRTVYELKEIYLKILVYSKDFAPHIGQGGAYRQQLNFVDYAIAYQPVNQLTDIIYEEIRNAF